MSQTARSGHPITSRPPALGVNFLCELPTGRAEVARMEWRRGCPRRASIPEFNRNRFAGSTCASTRGEAYPMANQARSTGILRTALAAAAYVLIVVGPAGAQKQGGSIAFGLELDIPGFDPIKVGVYDTAAASAAALIFDTLTSRSDGGDAVPKLALSWTHSDDYKTWTFKLRPG